ncbi:MAG: MerR family transcriptional regulator [Tannerellaceae bacterium]|jgi:DNA-binding transcriptional MerR regulator|nr:MerR family transcriptional regulator [Tannerellaceae bacterium]
MVLRKDKDLKRFFSIGEVAKMLDLPESTLRFWEREFEILRPQMDGKKGSRRYTRADIDVLRDIRFLVKDQKMTLEGARAKLKVKPKETSRQAEIIVELKEIRSELQRLKDAFDGLN